MKITDELKAELERRFPWVTESFDEQASLDKTTWQLRASMAMDELNRWYRGMERAQ